MPPSRAPEGQAAAPTGPRPSLVALLLVGSGFCALVYEVAWLRMLRLFFGVSTAASAAVLAIFLGGLGLGGLLLGRRADRARSPLRLYADLETGVAVAARLLAARAGAPAGAPPESAEPAPAAAAPAALVLVAAAFVGFAFLLMELVWYRMLAPLLGGSTYTFGLILAVALAGIGAGGLVYAAGARARRPTLVGFVTTCVVEALCIALPYALGDRVALLAMQLRPLGFLGFGYLVLVWLPVTMLVVLPAAVVAGCQFPLLVGLLRAGERGVGREVGLAYAANTAGAIVGSLAGGFGLIPLLTAPGAWRAVVLVLVALGAVCPLQALRGGAPGPRAPARRA